MDFRFNYSNINTTKTPTKLHFAKKVIICKIVVFVNIYHSLTPKLTIIIFFLIYLVKKVQKKALCKLIITISKIIQLYKFLIISTLWI